MPGVILSVRAQKSFKKRLKSGSFPKKKFDEVIDLLKAGIDLPAKYVDHALKGRLEGYRELHLEYDLLIQYAVEKGGSVILIVALGTHSELFGP